MIDILEKEQALVKQGWVEESNETYHSGPGLGSTGIKLLCETPRHYQKGISTIDPEVARIGTLIHLALLEPEFLFSKLVVPPSGSRVLKEVKAKWALFWERMDKNGFLARPLEEVLKLKVDDYHTAYNDKCIPASVDDVRMCKRIQETIGEYPSYKEKVEGDKEVSGHVGIDWDVMEVRCKVRPDVRNSARGYLTDVKTVSDIDMFERNFFKLGYHISAAFYLDLANILDGGCYEKFYFLVIEKKEPYSIMLYKVNIDDQLIDLGRTSYELGVSRFVDCTRSGKWPGYVEETRPIVVPKWMLKDVD